MKKLLIVLLALFATVSVAHATVGGPTYFFDLKYNPADTSIYFNSQSYSGRGCPPVLSKMSVTDSKITPVINCDQAEKLTEDQLAIEVLGVTASLKDLTQIDLTKNGITINLAYDHPEYIPNTNEMIRTVFTATVFQDGVEIGKFPVSGCSADQPFLFAGYAIPGLNKKIALLLSTKGDCWEGGYIYESLYVVNGEIKDRSVAGPEKTNKALQESDATLSVWEQSRTSGGPVDSNNSTVTPTTPVTVTYNNGADLMTIIAGIAILALGVALGYIVRMKKQDSENQK